MELSSVALEQIPGVQMHNRQFEQITDAPNGDRYHVGDDCAVIESGHTLYIAGNVQALEVQAGHEVFLFGSAEVIVVHGGSRLTVFMAAEAAEPSLVLVKEYPGLCIVMPGDEDPGTPSSVHAHLQVLDALLPHCGLSMYEQLLVQGTKRWITGPQTIGQW